jgi:hypothetical protein
MPTLLSGTEIPFIAPFNTLNATAPYINSLTRLWTSNSYNQCHEPFQSMTSSCSSHTYMSTVTAEIHAYYIRCRKH